MSLKDWEKHGWLRPHRTSSKEVADLFEIVERDLKAATTPGLADDWKFGIAYNAALKLCTILLNSEGYRPENSNAHFRTLQALPEILGSERKSDADYLNSCRSKRNTVEYEHIDGVTEDDALELIRYVEKLKSEVTAHLNKNHSAVAPGEKSGKK